MLLEVVVQPHCGSWGCGVQKHSTGPTKALQVSQATGGAQEPSLPPRLDTPGAAEMHQLVHLDLVGRTKAPGKVRPSHLVFQEFRPNNCCGRQEPLMAPVLCPPQCVTDTALLWLHPEHLQDGHLSPLLIPQPSHPSALKTRKKSQHQF